MDYLNKKLRPSILIVDDVPKNIQVLASLLSKENYQIAAATGGLQALQMIEKINPDIILLDIMMPDLSGIDVCINLKQSEKTKHIPVIFLTAKSETEDVVAGLQAGAVDYVTKPFNFIELLSRVRTHIELKKNRDLIMNMNEELKKATQAKSDFLANMSHEIRTPMNAILGMAEMLWQSSLTPDQMQYVRILNNAGQSLLDLINDILDLSKVEAGRIELEESEFDLRELIENTCEILALNVHQRNLEFICHIHENVPTQITGDSVRIRQILVNLIGNAIKFTQKGEIKLTVSLDDDDDSKDSTKDSSPKDPPRNPNEKWFKFSVIDTGIGISSENQKKIFETYIQANSSTTRRYGGTGLGLTICKKLTELMDGRIWVESEEGKGSVFSFSTKLKTLSKDHVDNSDILKDINVLVVEDNESNCLVLKEMLLSLGANIMLTKNCQECINEIETAKDLGKKIEVILLDGKMSDNDNFKSVQMIKDNFDLKIILMLRADNSSKKVTIAKKLGIEYYLIKPLKKEGLKNCILKALCENKPSKDCSSIEEIIEKDKKSLNILLMEDHPNNQMVFSFYIQDTNHKLNIADNGQIGFDKYRARKYDLIFMDMLMPVMDGYETTKKIREWEETNNLKPVPIIALTAMALKDDERRIIKAGCTGYIPKPLKKEVLIECIKKHVNP